MKKWVYIILLVIVVIIAIFVGRYLFKNEKPENIIRNNMGENLIDTQNNVTNNEVLNEISVSTVEKEKVSPNATLILKKHYEECDHTIKEYAKMPEEYVNLTEEELIEKQEGWEIEKFSNDEVILIKNLGGVCNQHYVLREKSGNIAVYKIGNDNEETLIEETGIAVEYLTTNDKLRLNEGIRIYGEEELNSALEDYE